MGARGGGATEAMKWRRERRHILQCGYIQAIRRFASVAERDHCRLHLVRAILVAISYQQRFENAFEFAAIPQKRAAWQTLEK